MENGNKDSIEIQSIINICDDIKKELQNVVDFGIEIDYQKAIDVIDRIADGKICTIVGDPLYVLYPVK